jgi:PhnB protein
LVAADVSNVQEVHVKLHIYLNYGGNCEEAFKFYETHLGGTITMLMRHGEQPGPSNVPTTWNGKGRPERWR